MIQVSHGNNRVAVYKNGKCVWFKKCKNQKHMSQVYYKVMTVLTEAYYNEI